MGKPIINFEIDTESLIELIEHSKYSQLNKGDTVTIIDEGNGLKVESKVIDIKPDGSYILE